MRHVARSLSQEEEDMKAICRFHFTVQDEFAIAMPKGAVVLSVQVQGGYPCIWAMVDDDASRVDRKFALRETGDSCDGLDPEDYRGTFQVEGGFRVYHMFDLG